MGYAMISGGWILFTKPAYKGKIIDSETKEPIEGAVVVAVYNKYPIISGPGGGSSSKIHIQEVLTDRNGVFRIPFYITFIGPNSVERWTDFIIYKPGYGRDNVRMTRSAMEHFFLEDNFEKKGEIILSFTPPEKRNGTYGVLELIRVVTKEERLRAQPSEPSDLKKDCPLLYKAVNEERKSFGLKPVGR